MDPRQAVALVLDRMDAAVRRAGPEFVELEKRLRLQLQLERANDRIAELEAANRTASALVRNPPK